MRFAWSKKMFQSLESGMAIASGVIVYGMAIAVFFEVVTRFLHVGVSGIYETVELSLTASVFLALSWIQRGDHHIRLRGMLMERIPDRFKVLSNLPWLLISLFVYVMFFWRGIAFTSEAIQIGTHSIGLVEVPYSPFYSVMVLGSFIMIIRLLIQLKKAIFNKVIPGED